MSTSTEKLHTFITYCQQHIKGDEKGEAQVFLDRFFRAFGHEGALEAGACYEERVKKGSKTGKTGFADLVWKPRVLIEMKKRGEKLQKHYSQAFDYWTRLVPDRPRYVILCNFNEFWIFDFDIQLDTPIDIISLQQLPERAGAFTFMELENRTPGFNNNQVEVTERAARRLGELFVELKNTAKRRGFTESVAQRFILQCVLAMFAEDRGLLPRNLFISSVQNCLNGASSYDILGGLFREMNTPGITGAGRYKGVDYFNGGLFSVIHPIELTREELQFLDVSAREDWSQVRPAIFGNIFEGSVNVTERHTYGIHYTSEADIMKIVRPTISRYWEDRIEAATTIPELNGLQMELQSYRVLDPACGSGNFLYIAYQELKRIEQLLLEKIASRRKSPREQLEIGFVTPLQFYGMDTNPFAVELARVTLAIARKVAIDKFGLTEDPLPLDTLDKNIVCQDALFNQWPKVNAIIGNPPFLGGHRIRQELGNEYAERIFNQFSAVKDKVDICSYWFRLSHETMQENIKGRVGLVATNSISQGNSRKSGLDYITSQGGVIHEAISSQPWSGHAKVHVSVINWCYQPTEVCYLDHQVVPFINSSLQNEIDCSKAVRLKSNMNYSFKGVQPSGKGFLIESSLVDKWLKVDPRNQQVIQPFLDATDLARHKGGLPSRWIVDFNDMTLEEASEYSLPFEEIKRKVKPERETNRREATRIHWWQHGEKRPAMRQAIASLSVYFSVPRHSKWFIFLPAQSAWLPGDSTTVVASDDFYILGILTSKIHRLWVTAQSSTLEDRIRYTHKTCFETFPFPQTPDSKQVSSIREITQKLHDYRTQQMESKQWGITQLYNKFFAEPTSQLSKLHAELDKRVMQAYHFQPNDDILEKLFQLNGELADKEARGEVVLGPQAP